MNKRLILFVALMSLSVIAGQSYGVPIQWEVSSGGNGHYFEYVDAPLTFWEAQSWAQSNYWEGWQGYLASFHSAEEYAFVMAMVPTNSRTMYGLYQPSGSSEPAGGWVWVSGESVEWTNWWPGEPNNSSNQEWIAMTGTFGTGHLWNDMPNWASAFVVEYGDPGVIPMEQSSWGDIKSIYR